MTLIMKRFLSLALVFMLALGAPTIVGAEVNTQDRTEDMEISRSEKHGYESYLSNYPSADSAKEDLKLSSNNYNDEMSSGIKTALEKGKKGWEVSPNGELVFNVSVDKDSLYNLSFDYLTKYSGVVDGTISILIDEKTPFNEVVNLPLPRIWENDGKIMPDSKGNDLRPNVVEVYEWQRCTVADPSGKQAGSLLFFLEAGEHNITLKCGEIDLYLTNVTLDSPQNLPSYQEYISRYKNFPIYDGSDILIEAEKTFRTSSRFLIAGNDMSSPLTTPSSAYKIKLNTLSGANWRYVGDKVTWKFNVDKEGLYRISFRFMQNTYNGMDTHRRLFLNGQVPFSEVDSISFGYKSKWQTAEAGEYYYYLKAGENTISMEVVLGKYSEILRRVEDLTFFLNSLYRRIIMVTGPYPDIYRDYYLEQEVPGLVEAFETALKDVDDLSNRFKELTGVKQSSELSVLTQLSVQIKDTLNTPGSLTKGNRLDRFKSNISSLGAWINKIREQPLQLDSLTLLGEKGSIPKANAGFFTQLKYNLQRFFASFTVDFTNFKGSSDENWPSIKVWMFSGRDQAQLLKSMVDSSFSAKKKINVSIELVSGGIIEAMLAGKGPDVALGRAESDPVDYAMRGATLDLSEFKDFDGVVDWFEPGTMNSFKYRGGYYALPETQVFNMLFYRTDILEEFGLSVPKTWDELLRVSLPVLQQHNTTIGVGNLMEIADNTLFTALLYQMGGQIYGDDGLSATLDTQVAYEAFKLAVEIYRDYGAPWEYDFLNRFRTGEIPMAIAPYTMYNNLVVGAPEISGMWDMTEIPGVLTGDGTLVNTQVMGSTAALISAKTKQPDACWEFLKWWVSSETQAQFGNSIEAILGAGGRYTPANREALRSISWNVPQLKKLESQRAKNTVLPQLPGSYFTKRAIYNAFVSSVIDSKIPREELLLWNEEIDLELARKRREFGLDKERRNRQ